MTEPSFPAFGDVQLPFPGDPGTRRVSFYLPAGFRVGGATYPVVYCADGGAVPAFGMKLARETQAGLVPATILIGVDSSLDARAEEYLPGVNPQRFNAHADFFANSVADWARQELGVSADRQSTAVFGVSNGGTFAVAIGSLNPHKFGYVLAFSVAKSPIRIALPARRPDSLPKFYLAAGKTGHENAFRRHTAALAKFLVRHGIDCTFSARDGGHDLDFWRSELTPALNWAFGTKNLSNYRARNLHS
jgi:enterochelin esterase-like enzyme